MQLQFLGATGTVTGSKYLIEAGRARALVDCGLFQGYKQLRLRNWADLPIAPSGIHAVVLTHAHLDHSGYLPLLVRNGFRGKVRCTEATYELCRILLPDSARLLEEEAAYANRKGYSKHQPALPLYTVADAERALRQFEPVEFDRSFVIAGSLLGRFARAGHILGAAMVTIEDGLRSICFSGDLGRSQDVLMPPPDIVRAADYLVLESTYGDRLHDRTDPMVVLAKTIKDTAARGGVVVIPAFAVGRAQELIYYMHRLRESGAIGPDLPIYLNSPMAADVTDLYSRYHRDHRLSAEACRAMCESVRIVNSVEESITLNRQRMPMVIIAASGMATGGRVLHHLKAFAPDPRNTILFAGFQAGGTRGAAMLAGADAIKIHGEYVPVRAKVVQIENLSAHADADEILAWLRNFETAPREVFLTHGEPHAADVLRRRIEEELHWRCRVPEYLEGVALR
ncbi:MAG TPA: MBL fold metallo-hydrolase [Noviherbaspirillum sp.]|nr:MBL fold metallo-hydrolase [Noviherbaspirillum sp.]